VHAVELVQARVEPASRDKPREADQRRFSAWLIITPHAGGKPARACPETSKES